MFATNDTHSVAHNAVQASNLETLPGGGTVEWLEDRRMVVYHTPNASRLALQSLFDRGEAVIREWPSDRPYLAVLDLSSEEVGATPYARERGRGLMSLRPDLTMITSMLMRRSVQAQFFQLIVRFSQRRNRVLAVHFAREEAIDWLKKMGKID